MLCANQGERWVGSLVHPAWSVRSNRSTTRRKKWNGLKKCVVKSVSLRVCGTVLAQSILAETHESGRSRKGRYEQQPNSPRRTDSQKGSSRRSRERGAAGKASQEEGVGRTDGAGRTAPSREAGVDVDDCPGILKSSTGEIWTGKFTDRSRNNCGERGRFGNRKRYGKSGTVTRRKKG